MSNPTRKITASLILASLVLVGLLVIGINRARRSQEARASAASRRASQAPLAPEAAKHGRGGQSQMAGSTSDLAATNSSGPTAFEDASSYQLGPVSIPTRARDEWAEKLFPRKEPISNERMLEELVKIFRMPEGEDKATALNELLYRRPLDLSMTQTLLTMYDEQAPGVVRDALLASLLFSTEVEYVSDQLIARAYRQSADERGYFFLTLLPAKHEAVWNLLCESIGQCQTEEAAKKAALAISSIVSEYGIRGGHQRFGSHMKELLRQTQWPTARRFLFHAMATVPSIPIREEFRAAVAMEQDEELRKYAEQHLRLFRK